MEFRQLVYFVAVAEDLHFRKAANRLHIAQPALSQQIRSLEKELGVSLLARSSRSVELTPAGRVFLDDARRMLELRQRAAQSAIEHANGKIGILRAAYVGPAAYSVLHTVINAYRRARPHIDLQLSELTNTAQLDALVTRTLDIGIVRLPILDSRFATSHLFTEPVIVVLPEHHHLAAHREIPLELLAEEEFIMVPRSVESSVFDRYVSLCQEAGFSPRIAHQAPLIHTHVELVAVGMGVALAPGSVRTLQRPGVVYRDVSSPHEQTVSTGLAWLDTSDLPAIHDFATIAREAVASASTRADP